MAFVFGMLFLGLMTTTLALSAVLLVREKWMPQRKVIALGTAGLFISTVSFAHIMGSYAAEVAHNRAEVQEFLVTVEKSEALIASQRAAEFASAVAQEEKLLEATTVNEEPIIIDSKVNAYVLFQINPPVVSLKPKVTPKVVSAGFGLDDTHWWYTDKPSVVNVHIVGDITPISNGEATVCMQPSATQTDPRKCWLVKVKLPS